MPAVEAALAEFAADLVAVDRGLTLGHRAPGVRIEVKPQFAVLLSRAVLAWTPKPLSQPAHETLVIAALKQPVTLADIQRHPQDRQRGHRPDNRQPPQHAQGEGASATGAPRRFS